MLASSISPPALENLAASGQVEQLFLVFNHQLANDLSTVKASAANTLLTTLLVDPGYSRTAANDARQLVARLNASGLDSRLIVLPTVYKRLYNLQRKRSVLLDTVSYLLGTSVTTGFAELQRGYHHWQNPPLANQALLSQFAYLKRLPMDEELMQTLRFFYRQDPYLLSQYPLESYLSFDVLKLAARTQTHNSHGPYLQAKTHFGSELVVDLSRYARYEPTIVVGIDDERNLFRVPVFYKTRRQYSWRDAEPTQWSARPLGAFLHFRKPVPLAERIPLIKRSALVADSIQIVAEDPWTKLEGLPAAIRPTVRNNCIYCHQTLGIGGYAGHLNAKTAKLQGGFALTLEDYPVEVMRAFLFEQEAVAKKIGVQPNPVRDGSAEPLYEWHRSLER